MAHRLVGTLVGTGVVVCTGLLGRRAGGPRAGLAAAAIAAAYPILIAADGSVMSEPLAALTVALAMLAAYRYADAPGDGRAALFGLAIGLAALARAESLLLAPLLALPVIWTARARRGRRIAVVAAAVVVTLLPWTIRNWTVFDRPVLLSTNLGSVAAGANCQEAYHGTWTGGWWPPCLFRAANVPTRAAAFNEAKVADEWFASGRSYAVHHLARLSVVVPVRVLRTWSLWQPHYQTKFFDGENRAFAGVSVWPYFVVLGLAAFGVFALRRRRLDLIILLAPLVMVTLSSALGFGAYRFRLSAEPALLALAGVALARRLRT